MKSIVLLTIINLINFIINKTNLPSSVCQITLIDDDTWGKDNATYNSYVRILYLKYDLRKDVKEIVLKNNTPNYPCKYSLYTCKKKNFGSCKKWSGRLGPRQTKKLRSSYIKKMVSIKGYSKVQVPPKPKPIVIKAAPKPRKINIPKVHIPTITPPKNLHSPIFLKQAFDTSVNMIKSKK